jgi:hypothetical protein
MVENDGFAIRRRVNGGYESPILGFFDTLSLLLVGKDYLCRYRNLAR